MKNLFVEKGNENLVVILGAPSADSVELYAETVVNGDPTWAGPLAGVAMKLPVFHVLEEEISSQIDQELYKKNLAIMEMALEVDKISEVLSKIRASM